MFSASLSSSSSPSSLPLAVMRASSPSVRSLEVRPRRALQAVACLLDRRHVSSPSSRRGDSVNLVQGERDFRLFHSTKQVYRKKGRDEGIRFQERIRRDPFTSPDSRKKKEFNLSRVSDLVGRQEEVSFDRLFRHYAIDSSLSSPLVSSPSSSSFSSFHPPQPLSFEDFMRRSFCHTRDLSFPSPFSACDVLSSLLLHAPSGLSFRHASLLSRSIRLSFYSFSSLPSTSSSGCRRRPRDSSHSEAEGVGRERNVSRKVPLSSSSSSSSAVSSSSSVSSPFTYVSKTVLKNEEDKGERTTGSRFQYKGRLAGGIASASLLLALAFRKWAQEQEEKRKGMWWVVSSPSSSSFSSRSGHSSSSFSSAFEDRPLQPHPFIPLEDSCASIPRQVPNIPSPSGVYTPERNSEENTIVEGVRTFLSPLGPVAISSSSPCLSLSPLSPVNQLATSLAVSLSSRFKKISGSPTFPQGGEASSTKNREEGVACQQQDPGEPREGGEEDEHDEAKRKEALELLRNLVYGRPVRVETLGELAEEGEGEQDEGKEGRKGDDRRDGCVVQLHDCRVLASEEGRIALEEILKATGTIDLTATDYEGLDDEDKEAWEVIKGGNDKTIMELWQSAAFRKIVEVGCQCLSTCLLFPAYLSLLCLALINLTVFSLSIHLSPTYPSIFSSAVNLSIYLSSYV